MFEITLAAEALVAVVVVVVAMIAVIVVIMAVIGWGATVKWWCWWGTGNVESEAWSTNAWCTMILGVLAPIDKGRISRGRLIMTMTIRTSTSGLYTTRRKACAIVSRMANFSQSLPKHCQGRQAVRLMQAIPRPNGQMAKGR